MIRRLTLFKDVFDNKDKIILRDYLALERTKLANERTFMAYLRTSLYMVLGGIAFIQLEDFKEIPWAGYAALGISIILIVVGLYRYLQIRHRLKNYYASNNETDQS
ncbi:MAG: DUF202 domain-containing protein [Melioribacteraceae bacterium]|nr:DUF202 domain-containing protein [Melioribacteraceae bacterium]MDD3559531.1 DUF202 domain-containing protein [Melioribacteraceae bacterium]